MCVCVDMRVYVSVCSHNYRGLLGVKCLSVDAFTVFIICVCVCVRECVRACVRVRVCVCVNERMSERVKE